MMGERKQRPLDDRGLQLLRLPALAALSFLPLAACGGGPLEPLPELPRELSVAERELVSAGNAFALDLYGRLATADRGANAIVSPLSAFYSLGMVANGADGETLEAMRRMLGQAGLDEEEANEAYRGLLDLLLGLDPGVELRLPNSVWYEEDFPVRPSFVELARRFFDAEVRGLEFDAPSAPASINGWVEEATEGRIRELIETIDPLDVMFVINAVYFHGEWQATFERDRTRSEAFHRLDGSTVQVPMMQRPSTTLRHQAREAFEAIELPYNRGAFVMTVLLPPEGVAPADLVAGTEPATWESWMDGFEERKMAVEMPRFGIEWEKLLNDDLAAMGMEPAFDRQRANFLRLVEENVVLPGRLYISRVRQKAFIEVDEEGTEAAAATSTGVTVVSSPRVFRIDRPFLFAIRERFSGVLLFMGQVLDPTAG